jgi:serine/threonine protein kinase/Tol biopolymer transport system component
MKMLEPGTQLSHYEILAPIGKGGMGEVYQARDTKLDRDVAIKVLPHELASDSERLARFEREARLLASLNHPNIASIHGFEESDGVNALVLELVEGPTLAERIAKGPIPVDEAVEIAKQIAEALDAGHEAGVIHRDLKPANIKVKEDGTVKVLDYGLAKALEGETPAGTDAELSQSPTLTRQGTQVGVILGTAAYMSPEQAKGKVVDKRTDIWSFGAVLYEMLTGRRVFVADDVHETLAHVLTRDVDWDALPSNTPKPLRRMLRRTLQRDRRERLADIADARLDIVEALSEPLTTEESTGPGASGVSWRQAALVSLAAAIVVGSIVGSVAWNARAPAPPTVARLTISPSLDEAIRLPSTSEQGLTVSPDGSVFVYISGGDGSQRRLLVRRIDQLTASTLVEAGHGALGTPFVSPDGRWVGYRHGEELRRVPIEGGPRVTICRVSGFVRGASWGDDGYIVFADIRGGLYRVLADGGQPELLLKQGGTTYPTYQWPEVLPGSRAVLFTMRTPFGAGSRIAVYDPDWDEPRDLFQGTQPRYASSGHIVYVDNSTLWAVPFDLETLEPRGDAAAVETQIGTYANEADFAISANGVLAYVPGLGAAARSRRLVWVDRDGQPNELDFGEDRYGAPVISPDGTKLAIWLEDDVWVYDMRRGSRVRLTSDGGNHPVWTPDGDRVAFEVPGKGLFSQSADGSDEAVPLFESELNSRPESWLPDGSELAYSQLSQESGWDIWTWSQDGSSVVIDSPFDEDGAMFSPDGRWLAYVSDETGTREVYVVTYPGLEDKVPLSVGGGRAPVWSPRGDEIFYRDLEGRLFAVSVDPDAGFEPSRPELLFDGPYATAGGGDSHYDVSPDGRRFLMVASAGASRDLSPRLVVVLNWPEELKRLVPTEH